MLRSGENDSPFKRDDPVARSRKWVLIVYYFWLLSLALTLVIWLWVPQLLSAQLSVASMLTPLWYLFARDQDYWEIFDFLSRMGFLFFILISMIVMTIQIRRIARAMKHCREKRSFDVMAAAVRSQHFFWGMAGTGAFLTAIFFLFFCSQMIPRIKGLEELVRREKARQEQMPVPIPVPQP